MAIEFIQPNWPVPSNVRACVTTRHGGVSLPPYDTLNLGAHTDDEPARVAENRARLARELDLPQAPAWLVQVHGTRVVPATEPGEADASWTNQVGPVCAILTADCLPVLFCDRRGTRVAVAHAGWRGLAAGVLEATVRTLGGADDGLMAWLGPAIGPTSFEVGDEVRDAFLAKDRGASECFAPSPGGRWLADLYALARRRLARCGVADVYGGGFCTFRDSERFYSYRRDGATGRMASLVWRVS